MTLQIGFVLFPGIQQLDLTGPYDVLGSLPDVKLHLVWKDLAPVTSSTRCNVTSGSEPRTS